MSRKNLYQNIHKQTWFKIAYILVIIIIVVLVVILDKHQKTRQKQINESIAAAQTKLLELAASSQPENRGIIDPNSTHNPPDIIPVTEEFNVYNWQGEVTKVEDNKIVFRSSYENSLTKGDDYLNITVNLKPETKFFQLDLSKPLAQNEIIYSRTSPIEKSDIHAGDKIIAQSDNDLNLNLEMEVTAVYLIDT